MDLRSRYPRQAPIKLQGPFQPLLPWHVAAKAQHLPRRADVRAGRTHITGAGRFEARLERLGRLSRVSIRNELQQRDALTAGDVEHPARDFCRRRFRHQQICGHDIFDEGEVAGLQIRRQRSPALRREHPGAKFGNTPE